MKKPGHAPSVTQNIGSVISHTSMAYELPWITNHRIWQLNELLNFALGVALLMSEGAITKGGAMKALTLLTAAALTLLSAASGYAQTGAYYGKGKAPPPSCYQRLERVGGPAIVPVPFVLGGGLQTERPPTRAALKFVLGRIHPQEIMFRKQVGM